MPFTSVPIVRIRSIANRGFQTLCECPLNLAVQREHCTRPSRALDARCSRPSEYLCQVMDDLGKNRAVVSVCPKSQPQFAGPFELQPVPRAYLNGLTAYPIAVPGRCDFRRLLLGNRTRTAAIITPNAIRLGLRRSHRAKPRSDC